MAVILVDKDKGKAIRAYVQPGFPPLGLYQQDFCGLGKKTLALDW